MLVEIQTAIGPRKVRVCDYCKTVCIPSGRFCSGSCAKKWDEFYAAVLDSHLSNQKLSPCEGPTEAEK